MRYMYLENGNEAELCRKAVKWHSVGYRGGADLYDGYQRQEGPLDDVAHSHGYAKLQDLLVWSLVRVKVVETDNS